MTETYQNLFEIYLCYFFSLAYILFVYMERAGFMT